MARSTQVFPTYTAPERLADRVIHIVGLAAAPVGIAWLLLRLGGASPLQVAAVVIYSAGLIGMLSASAGYNLVPASRLKVWLRRIDQSMIYVMIAGSYTPFALIGLGPHTGGPLCILIWILAALGIVLNLSFGHRFQAAGLVLYMAMGWLVIFYIRALIAAVPAAVLVLLVSGGVIYSIGMAIHATARLKFHNPIWHAMVAVAAALHLVAIANLLPSGAIAAQ
jgi:hemolysin III